MASIELCVNAVNCIRFHRILDIIIKMWTLYCDLVILHETEDLILHNCVKASSRH